jgi:mRNA interferase MazF
MGPFVSGQVVVLRFPFADLTGDKKRPALVLACTGSYTDVIVCAITAPKHSTTPVEKDFSVEITDADFAHGKLRESKSCVRPDHLFTAAGNRIQVIGSLKPSKMDEIMNQVALIFGFRKDETQP